MSEFDRLWHAGSEQLSGHGRHREQWRMRQCAGFVVVAAEGHLLAEAVAYDDLQRDVVVVVLESVILNVCLHMCNVNLNKY